MTEYFVIGDVHGKIGMLQQLLKHWDGQSQLVFLGDLIDRGEDARAVVSLVRDLVQHQGAICLAGNHEYMFTSWLADAADNYDHYQSNGGDTTINSFLGRELAAPVQGLEEVQLIKDQCSELVDFIQNLPFVYETEHYIFVHAGLDLSLSDWHDTTDYQKVWLRKPFHEGENTTGKTIVFGHTPVYRFWEEEPGSERIWQTADGKLGMDGGAVYGGVLHGLLLTDQGIKEHHIIHHDGVCLAVDD